MKKWVKVFLPAAIILGSLLILSIMIRNRPVAENKPPVVSPPLVRVTAATLDTVQILVRSQGAVMPRTESTLSSETDGQIVYVSPAFVPGGFFEAGEILARLDPREAELAITRAAADTVRFATALQIEQEEAVLAQAEWDRLGSGAPRPLAMRAPQLAQAQANLDASVAALRQAMLNLERTEIRAPYAGRIRRKQVDVGQFLRRGEALATIYAITHAEIRLPVPDEELAFFEIPMRFRGETSQAASPRVVISGEFAGRRHQWDGRLIRMEGEIDPTSRMVYAVASVPNPYGRGSNADRPPLSIGMFVEAEILGRSYADVAIVPRSAMRGTKRLAIIDDDQRLRFRQVDVLRMESDQVLIRSGLEAGERVCLSALATPVEGMEVRILETGEADVVVQDEEGAGQ